MWELQMYEIQFMNCLIENFDGMTTCDYEEPRLGNFLIHSFEVMSA